MISNELELLYDRYNQFGYYEYTVWNPNTLIRILREGAFNEDFENKDDWSDQFDWMVDMALRMKKVFKKYL